MPTVTPIPSPTVRRSLAHLGLLAALALPSALFSADSPGVDAHTVALWLFDEPTYPNMVLTDASHHGYDLRLQAAYDDWYVRTEGKGEPPAEPLHVAGKYGLLPGKFGHALYVPDPAVARVLWPDNRQRYSSVSLLGQGSQVPERFNLGYFDWTIECWFRAEGPQPVAGTLFELRNEQDYPRGLPMEDRLQLEPGRNAFTLLCHTTNPPIHDSLSSANPRSYSFALSIPTDAARLNDGAWHHLAFCYTAEERQLHHYVDGHLQALPAKGGFLPMLGVLKHFSLGANVHGLIDEYRISDVNRYPGEFTPPAGFSRNYGPDPRPANRPDGPALLFAAGRDSSTPFALGSRKHVLIDGALLASTDNLAFRVHPPESHQETDLRNTEAWEPTPRMGSTIPDVCSIWDDGDRLGMLYTNSGMWGGKAHAICYATSRDGLHWDKPALGLYPWEGERNTNIVIADAGQGSIIRDPNPATLPQERYKYLSWSYYRGYYLYTSPDGIHFERNETTALPFDTDGSTSFFWDDQQGFYQAYFRCVTDDGKGQRRAGHLEIADIFKPFPFTPVSRPFIDDMILARPARGEMPIIDTGGQVYRFKAHKYAWAPDVYVAFPWRYLAKSNIRPGSFMMVSRDGTNWTRYEDPYYFPGGWELDGRTVLEALMEHGMVRRGAEIWQYGTVRFTEHGGALYGGVEHEGGIHDRLLRLVQRLDGFVAATPADPARGAATLVTKPLTFTGDHLELNLDASGGSARVELQDADGRPLPGFALADSIPLRENGVALRAAWRSQPDLGALAGRTVRLKVELTGAKLFAFQFR
ncbi:MAG TPA: hypothetical protein VG936_08000 [Lacunisphaera sp.]|nr:hypothetical protein [Lacunisphaera sp.]